MARTTGKTTTRGKKDGERNLPRDAALQSPITLRPSQILPPALQLLPYQRRWIEDNSPLKIVVKARQIGYSFASTLRVVFECLKRKTTWILLSKGERQSRLLMEKIQEHIQSCGIVARAIESEYFEGASIKQLETRFPNGSVIYGLPANPDTARGYSGNVTLDEFAFHADADKIYSALYPSITRGYSLEIISTPNGQQGKFYELAKAAGLIEEGTRDWGLQTKGSETWSISSGPTSHSSSPQSLVPSPASVGRPRMSRVAWSAHWCDIYDAVRQGLKIDLQVLRAGCEDDSAWRQEFGCQFVSTAENFFSPELLAACLSAEASLDTPTHLLARESGPASASRDSASGATSEFYLGIDIGRRHDRTVFWVDEVGAGLVPALAGDGRRAGTRSALADDGKRAGTSPAPTGSTCPSITRLVRTLSNVPFDEQLRVARELMRLREGNGRALICRAAIDATGMGAPLAESLAQEFGARVEPVVFTAAVKEDLAYRTKRRMENGLTLLPDSRDIRRAFSAIKKFVTVSGNLRFDAVRTDAGHSDEFWAKALADLAAEIRPTARLTDGFLADGKPLISPAAFFDAGADFARVLADFRF